MNCKCFPICPLKCKCLNAGASPRGGALEGQAPPVTGGAPPDEDEKFTVATSADKLDAKSMCETILTTVSDSCDVESVLLLTRFFVIHINIHDIGLHQNYKSKLKSKLQR